MLKENNIYINDDLKSKEDVFDYLVLQLKNENRNINTLEVVTALEERELKSTTGFENGIAIPHVFVEGISKIEIVIARGLNIDWNSIDGKNIDVVIGIFAPKNKQNQSFELITKLSRMLIDKKFQNQLRTSSMEEVLKIIENNSLQKQGSYIVAVSGCVNGLNQTYMLAEKLENHYSSLNQTIKVETRGHGGVQNRLTKEDIKNADYVLISCDVDFEEARFLNKKVVFLNIRDCFKKIEDLDYYFENSTVFKLNNNQMNNTSFKNIIITLKQVIPFIVCLSIFLIISYIFSPNTPIFKSEFIHKFTYEIFENISNMSLPVISAFIAYKISNKTSLVSGVFAGYIASVSFIGIIGAVVGGILSGYFIKVLSKFNTTQSIKLRELNNIVVMPILSIIFISVTMYIFYMPFGVLN